ncbi:MAG: hypothetical protein J6T80_06980 [Paludibacteraceae bacterium]|nr:hypothetical protein [Paludibacteraceae bacterium]
MKRLITLLWVSLICHSVFAEYAIINNIVYRLNLEKLTAVVLNFQSVGNDVVIPSHISYIGDRYVVQSISHYDFESSAVDSYYDAYHTQQIATSLFGDNWISDAIVEETIKEQQQREDEEAYFQYDYKYSRASINTLQLPNTIEYISPGAFDGMVRLRALFIPESVKVLPSGSQTVFNQSMPRLEHIIVLGLPIYQTNGDQTITFASVNDNGNFDYIERLKRKFDISRCPNLESFQVPEYANKQPILNTYTTANQSLAEITAKWNADIARSPYNNGAKIATPVLKTDACRDAKLLMSAFKQAVQYIKNRGMSFAYQNAIAYTKDSLENELKKHPYYNEAKLEVELPKFEIIELDSSRIANAYLSCAKRLGEQYREFVTNKMENNLRTYYPSKFVEAYIRLNPHYKPKLDSIYMEFRCLPFEEQSKIVIHAIDGEEITQESCRQKQWNQYSYLYENQTEFDRSYNTLTNVSFNGEIYERQKAKSLLNSYMNYASENSKYIKLKAMRKKPNEQTQRIISYLDEFKRTYYYSQAVEFILSQYPKVLAEYDKHKIYFVSQIDFFEAYTSENYGTILKTKKNK